MIRLSRPEPPSEIYNSRIYHKEMGELLRYSSEPTTSRFRTNQKLINDLRKYLSEMSRDKCAYCESRIGSSSIMHIDHYRPKGGVKGADQFLPRHYFWLAYEWFNLLPVCSVCARGKMNFFPLVNESNRAIEMASLDQLSIEDPLILDPCSDDPEPHFLFLDDGTVQPNSDKGNATISILKLNREPLIEARRNAIRNFSLRIETGTIRENEVQELFSLGTEVEFAAALRQSFLDLRVNQPRYSQVKVKGLGQIGLEDAYMERGPQSNFMTNLSFVQEVRRFAIKSIEIKNLRSIRSMKLDFSATIEDGEKEASLLLLGDNGVGKSTILQAIAMAMGGSTVLQGRKLKSSDYLLPGADSGFVNIISDIGHVVKLEFDKDRFFGISKSASTYLLGYGATRLLPKDGLKYRDPKNRYVNIANLFNYASPLNDAIEWMETIPDEEFERVATALFDLLDLSPSDKVIRRAKRVFIEDINGTIPIIKTSDGFQSMIALACDIMKTLSNDGAGYHTVSAIVLIDEIGNHLHPKWRLKIMEALRKTFPKIQFIVSTHEPLCLRGMEYGEVNVLLQEDKKKIRLLGKNELPDHTLLSVEQLLTSDLFGLLNTYDRKTEEKLKAYYHLLSIEKSKRTAQQEDEITQFSSELSGRELIGSTPQIQALYELVNEKFAEKIAKEDNRLLSQIKGETKAEIEKMLDDNELDWL